MKVAIVAESFLPQTNGVVHTVSRILDTVRARGIEAVVIAPEDPAGVPDRVSGVPVRTVASLPLPGYPDVRVASGPIGPVERLLRDFAPDVVHLASPFVLGWRATLAAHFLGLPTVAVYQTDMPGFARRYGIPLAERALWRRVDDIHSRAALNLVPSHATYRALADRGLDNLVLWRRGVDVRRFDPAHRDEAWRASVRRDDSERLVGFIGRLAPEKRVSDLIALQRLPRTRLVIVGDGPDRPQLERLLPDAVFTGMLHGDELARVVASLDLAVHTGENDTFCQVIQEAMASGLPVVAAGAGGPLDLVDPSRTGWLYEPGNLAAMRGYVADLVGDDAKRQAMGRQARASVLGRTWESVCTALVGHWARAADTVGAPTPMTLRHRVVRRMAPR
ncbi:glycosyltransferase family 1 protein [Aeromicrobium camelliae]|uniref:Glycosyltransferase family 1 protein n=2 Tax=Aeromicrobium TaxID=2040 RepID=A0A3N6X1P1_9ACTN|nr:glycosyltransferase family 1 protein [Aeromicrobium camelliae]RQN07648.1 glycosyltransferase family 1 protein [Aeromicrobium camelliae]